MGGGVGTRGPGESQLETDRRMARRRVALLRRRLKSSGSSARRAARSGSGRNPDRRARGLHERRQVDAAERAHRRGCHSVQNRLFETLDPTTRAFEDDRAGAT